MSECNTHLSVSAELYAIVIFIIMTAAASHTQLHRKLYMTVCLYHVIQFDFLLVALVELRLLLWSWSETAAVKLLCSLSGTQLSVGCGMIAALTPPQKTVQAYSVLQK